MKKLVFTIEIIVLLALFPVYLVAELNHGASKKPAENTSLACSGLQLPTENQPLFYHAPGQPFIQ